jgi:hypothetical protein
MRGGGDGTGKWCVKRSVCDTVAVVAVYVVVVVIVVIVVIVII